MVFRTKKDMEMNDLKNAALLLRTPDEFEIVVAALEVSEGLSLRDKLDDALKSVAISGYGHCPTCDGQVSEDGMCPESDEPCHFCPRDEICETCGRGHCDQSC